MEEATRADLALLISIVTAVVAVIAIAFNVFVFWRSGRHVRVELTHARMSSFSIVTSGAKGWHHRLAHLQPTDRLSVEVARVQVTNVGRSPLWVTNVGIDLGRVERWRRARRSITPRVVRWDGYDGEQSQRLEPGETALYLFDHWLGLRRDLADASKPITVRGRAVVAGRRRPKLSPRRHRWRLEPGSEPTLPDLPTPERRAFLAMWQQMPEDARVGGVERAAMCWQLARPVLVDPDGDREALDERLREIDEGVLGFDVRHAYEADPDGPYRGWAP